MESLESRELLSVNTASYFYQESSVAAVAEDLGTLDYEDISYDSSTFGKGWFRFTASRTGVFSAQLESPTSVTQPTSLNLYTTSRYSQMLRRQMSGISRLDYLVVAGDQYYLLLTNTDADDQLLLANLVEKTGNDITVHGTEGNDEFMFSAASGLEIEVNGISYFRNTDRATKVTIDGGGGIDVVSLEDSPGDDLLEAWPTESVFSGPGYEVQTTDAEVLHAYSYHGGNDTAYFHDSPGDDTYLATPSWGKLYGTGYMNRAKFFDKIYVDADSGGVDLSLLKDSTGDDQYIGRPESSEMKGPGFYHRIESFDGVHARASEGNDRAYLFGSEGDDNLAASPTSTALTGPGFRLNAMRFDMVTANGQGGVSDSATLYDSAGDDILIASPEKTILSGDGYYLQAEQFEIALGYARRGGNDIARLYGSEGDDNFEGRPQWSKLSSPNFVARVKYFDEVHAYADFGYGESGGYDTARLYDSAGDDFFDGRVEYGRMQGNGYSIRAGLFDAVYGYSISGGHDEALLVDSEGDDFIKAQSSWSEITRPSESNRTRAYAFDRVLVDVSSRDEVVDIEPNNTSNMHIQWPADQAIVHASDFYDAESPTLGFQNAIDALPAEGGVVILPVGTWKTRAGLILRSNVTLRGEESITGVSSHLTRYARNEAVLTGTANPGDSYVDVVSTEGFRVGDEVGLYAYGVGTLDVEHPTLIRIEPKRLWFDRPIASKALFKPENTAKVANYYPLIRGNWSENDSSIQNVMIENLELSGNFDSSTTQWRLSGPGLIDLRWVSDAVIRNNTIRYGNSSGILLSEGNDNLVTDTLIESNRGHQIVLSNETDTIIRDSSVRNAGYGIIRSSRRVSADGILLNGGQDVVVKNVLAENNLRFGFHVAGELTRDGVWSNLISRNNGDNGYHFCENNFAITLTESQIYNNLENGVGGIGNSGFFGDHFNVISNNSIHHNGRWGIHMANASDNVVVNNSILDNSQLSPGTYSGVYLHTARRTVLENNRIGSDSTWPSQLFGIHELGLSDDNLIFQNKGRGNLQTDVVVVGLHTRVLDSEGTLIGPGT